MGWLQKHLEDFVKPILGEVPVPSAMDTPYFSPQEMAVIKGMWRAVKREAKQLGKPILLAGRDVWIFEVLAQREGTPTVFRPDISRLTVGHVQEDYRQHFLFDTGFMGSIPKALRTQNYTMGSANRAEALCTDVNGGYLNRYRKTHVMLRENPHQIFPRMKGARSLVLKIENTPKYWQRGFYRGFPCMCMNPIPSALNYITSRDLCAACGLEIREDKRTGILQEFSEPYDFRRAAILTIQIYTDKSPAFVDGPVTIPTRNMYGF